MKPVAHPHAPALVWKRPALRAYQARLGDEVIKVFTGPK